MEMRFSDVFLKALEFSRDEAVRTGWHNISADHIMLGILRLEQDSVFEVLGCVGVSSDEFKSCLDDAVFVEEAVSWDERDSVVLSDGARSFLDHACLEARRCGSSLIEPLHFLLAACRVAGPYCHDFLDERGVTLRGIVEAAGMAWEEYGLRGGVPSSVISTGAKRSGEISSPIVSDSLPDPMAEGSGSAESCLPDPMAIADAIERRLREGYGTGIIPVS